MILIVNADDLGANQPVNEEIFDLIDSGAVTSASLMCNAPGFEHAVQQIPRFPHCSFGIHLNLTIFAPLSSSGNLEPILDENGHLSKKMLKTKMTSALRKAFLQELTLQVQRAFDAGVPVSHFDSHHHVHNMPELFPVLKSLQRKFGIRRVRSTINLLPEGHKMTAWRSMKKMAFDFALRHSYATMCPDGLGDFRDFYKLLHAGKTPRFRALELMTHPGATTQKYVDEVAALRSGWHSLLPPDVKVGSYRSL